MTKTSWVPAGTYMQHVLDKEFGAHCALGVQHRGVNVGVTEALICSAFGRYECVGGDDLLARSSTGYEGHAGGKTHCLVPTPPWTSATTAFTLNLSTPEATQS